MSKKSRKILTIVAIVTIVCGALYLACHLVTEFKAKHNLAQLSYEHSKLIKKPIYIKEYTSSSEYSYVPYIAVTDDYDGKVLLLRKDVTIGEGKPINEGFSFVTDQFSENASAYYKDSYMDRFLNTEYISRFSEYVKKNIAETNIIITNNDKNKELEMMKAKIFLLSLEEYNIERKESCLQEGKELKYFRRNTIRAMLTDGDSTEYMGYWTRTRGIYDERTYIVSDSGGCGWQDPGNYACVRPAFCMDGNTKIKLSNDVISGEKVYVLEGDD